ncbi:hypothetical protein Q0F99_07050 [Rathayibacter oskolensis]|uniref:hypothetical protein n=1 Tax=Rathayibacter oskolensis TaxID=1891671 RepID=UPI00265F090B|nr:hypothetical protein [Rathayibacter oskolensis]WKK72681.1 hypothetical protein Q0F99_07050 [Rathayibacter oskolensis]
MSMTTGATPTIERGVSRRDAAAAAWLAGAGMDTRPAGAFRVVADAFRGDDFEVIRLWHSAARLRRGGRPGQGVRVMIPLEGALVVQPDDPADDEVTLGPGAVAFLRCSEGATVVTDGPTARLEVMLGRPSSGSSARRRRGPSSPPRTRRAAPSCSRPSTPSSARRSTPTPPPSRSSGQRSSSWPTQCSRPRSPASRARPCSPARSP